MHVTRRVLVSLTALSLQLLSGVQAGAQSACDTVRTETFTVHLPVLGFPPDEEGQGWDRPKVWDGYEDAKSDSIVVPNGRPIYALIVSGYASNKHLDEMMVYAFARHLQTKGAYVHYAWWNNLLAPYMERPLHHPQSEPGDLNENALGFINMAAEQAGRKAVPSEDYQLVADAKRFIATIRQHNPNAIIVVVGHSMGGGAVVHVGAQTDDQINLLAPIDPVGNRNFPFAGNERAATRDFNWTRWRVSRDGFLGYRKSDWGGLGVGCVPTGPWLAHSPNVGSDDIRCLAIMFVHDAPTLRFGSNIINLHHRYQQEALFPFDYNAAYDFGHSVPTNGTSSQDAVPLKPAFCGVLQRCQDPGGWPVGGDPDEACCFSGDGVGWPSDGHGEIVGYRGPLPDPVPLGVRLRTSPECGSSCPNLTWPERSKNDQGRWVNGDGAERKRLLMALESLPAGTAWPHRPTNAGLCLVSGGLISRFETMNKPPSANAGDDQVVECTGQQGAEVTLDGSASTDPDGDDLSYVWTWPGGQAFGRTVTATFPRGVHCVTLTVTDPSGQLDRDQVTIRVVDTTPPELTVELHPNSLWPPNHKMADIEASVQAQDLCGDVASLTLVSVVSSEPDNGKGDGNTVGDIAGVEKDTLDTSFQLRSERQGMNHRRTYTVTYQATDDAGNRAIVAKQVVVENLPPGKPRGLTVRYDPSSGNHLSWLPSLETDFASFAIYRSEEPSFVPGPATLVGRTTSTAWTDPQGDGNHHHYRLTTFDRTDLESAPASPLDPLAGEGGDRPPLPTPVPPPAGEGFADGIRGPVNLPNPFKTSTAIRFALSSEGYVRLTVHDALGRSVATLADDFLPAGEHSILWNSAGARPGVYFYRLQVRDVRGSARVLSRTRGMLLVK